MVRNEGPPATQFFGGGFMPERQNIEKHLIEISGRYESYPYWDRNYGTIAMKKG
jgi:hypothetical protein